KSGRNESRLSFIRRLRPECVDEEQWPQGGDFNFIDISLHALEVIVVRLSTTRLYSLWLLYFVTLPPLTTTTVLANEVVAWGSPADVPPGLSNPIAISAGWGYTLAVTTEGGL